jgi:signal transduction histidine kinase
MTASTPDDIGFSEHKIAVLTKELSEAREQQAATAQILSVISNSPTDLQRVFAEIAANASRLCDGYDATVYQVDGGCLRLVAHHGLLPLSGSVEQYTLPLVPGFVTGRVVIERRTVEVADVQAEGEEYPESRDFALRLGFGTALGVPLLRSGEAIGLIYIRRAVVRPFTDRQIDLLKTFADQAVIAIENARLFLAEQAGTRELTERTQEHAETLEYQTAISDVLGVISQSKFDLQPVLDTIARVASNLCAADDVVIYLRDGDELLITTHHGSIPVPLGARRPIGRDWVSGRAVVDRYPIHVRDLAAAEDEFPLGWELAKQHGHRTTMAIPLMREDMAVGCILVRRMLVQEFADRQITLLRTFADQAVIAIENTRLFQEIAQKSHELEIASQHKSQFVANMSHELRTPLAAMLGYAELMQEGVYGALPEKSLPILARIRSNGKHLLGLINTVLDISKIEAGQFKLNLGAYAWDSIVDTVMGATESLAATKKLAFKTEVAKGLPYGLGDEQRLTQVLLNLVGNAIKFTDTGEVRITAGAENGHFTLSVCDTGPGIPSEECERVFEKFRQVDSSNTRAKGGTGLGLAIAKEIIGMHGGRIWVESTMGQGSTFRIELPVRAAATAGAT